MKRCIACGLAEAPAHFSMHWWDIGEIAGWVCHFCHTGRFPNDPIETYRRIRQRHRDGLLTTEAPP